MPRQRSPILALAAAVLAAMSASGAWAQDDDAAARCVALAGEPDGGVPLGRAELMSYLTSLQKARADCEAAAAAEPPDPRALFHVGVLLQREGVHERAVAHFRTAAEAGLAPAHTKLGDYHNFGIGPMEEDHERAVAAYRAAADGGDLAAVTTLGIMSLLGRGGPREPARALDLMQEAADGGYHFAQIRLGQIYLKAEGLAAAEARELGLPDPQKAAALLELAAAQGSITAQLGLAALFAGDGGGLAADPARQARWTRRAAQSGVPSATAALAFLHERGRGVAYDPVRAAQLYVAALETGKIAFDAMRGTENGYTPRWDRQTAIEFQKILREKGFYRGALDGIVGPMTRAGARKLSGG